MVLIGPESVIGGWNHYQINHFFKWTFKGWGICGSNSNSEM